MKKYIAWASIFVLTIVLFLFYSNTFYVAYFKESVVGNNPDDFNALISGLIEVNLFNILRENTKDNTAISFCFGLSFFVVIIGFVADGLLLSKNKPTKKEITIGSLLLFLTFLWDTLLAWKVVYSYKYSQYIISSNNNQYTKLHYWNSYLEPVFWLILLTGLLLYLTVSALYYLASKPNT